ncbi:hypothetical protein [Parasphingorhabdus sp.]|uniref:hypothetical protein n=1 Tax=Parasphingorhabdus sp. TaxID=2709688 RepID=UPI0035948AFA
MFTPARYVVVDDNPGELKKLSDCLQGIGAPCLPLQYDAVHGIDSAKLNGVRLLFLDLHLTTGGKTSDISQASSVIIGLLEQGIEPRCGPYVIILWTSHENHREEFEKYLEKGLDPLKAPLAVLILDKNKYLAKDGGKALSDDIVGLVAANPQLDALLAWEREVLSAAGATLTEISGLVTGEDRAVGRFSGKLDEVFSRIAYESAGKENAKQDPYSAVNAALMPFLSDRIANQRIRPQSDELWKSAVTKIDTVVPPSLVEAAHLNSMLHVAASPNEELKTGSWGAVTLLPEQELEDDAMLGRFNMLAKPMPSQIFCIANKPDRTAGRFCALRVGAECDFAQSRIGPIPFVLGFIVSATAARREGSLPKSEIVTPPFILGGFADPVMIIFNTHMQFSMVPSQFADWEPVCRLREQLLIQITSYGAQNSTRPSIVSFRPH